MRNHRLTKFKNSIVVKSIAFLIVSMLLIVAVGTYFFTERQMATTLNWTFNTNQTQLDQLGSSVNNEMKQFGDKMTLLAKSYEVQSMDPLIAGGYLKSYNISDLFISGETVTLYDRRDSMVCNNSMLDANKVSYPINFAKITPHRPYISNWYRDSDNTPKRAFGAVVSDRASGDGSLVASFSSRRLWKYFERHKIGKDGFLIAINAAGEILYHPDLKTWLDEPHKISEFGIKELNARHFETSDLTFQHLSDGKDYLINYNYNPTYDLGLISLQPKAEIDEMVSSVKFISWAILACSILVMLIAALWLMLMLWRPMNRLIVHINQITDGNLDVKDIVVGKRKDEIGQLSRSFNLMHNTIKRQIRELNAHREMLEQEVSERTKELEDANKKLDLISRTDELTKLPNRRDMNETIENEVGRSTRTRKPFCFIFIDIDHFKNVNDTYGHAAGDEILKAVAEMVRSLLRKYDVLARYGGEEFLTLLPETDLEGALIVAERFREQVEAMTIEYGEHKIKVTITLGVAQYDYGLGADRSIQLADKALYEGKESGRNKVVAWNPERTTTEEYKRAAMDTVDAVP
ncbi:diguanylate cyclase [Fibrobacter sp.]|uniref:sensor domain-containing diguanylate cyclase n=1 Tax=Fibrobacter sp. TaxID=35828 RepID=UPI00388D7AB5